MNRTQLAQLGWSTLRSGTTAEAPGQSARPAADELIKNGAIPTAVPHVVHVVESFGAGTAEVIAAITRGTPEFRHTIICGRRDESSSVSSDRLGPGTNIVHWQKSAREIHPVKDTRAFFELISLLRGLPQIDVLHTHSAKGGGHGRLAAKMLGFSCRTVYTTHCSPVLRTDVSRAVHLFYVLLERLFTRCGAAVIACSPSERDFLRQRGIKARMIINGVSIDSVLAAPQATETTRRIFRAGTMGRATIQKDPAFFRQVAAASAARGDAVEFIWIGGGELAGELRSARLDVTGWVDEAHAESEMARLDVFVSTSRWEGLSLGVLKAMAMSKPLILRRCAGNVDAVIDGVNGFLFDTVEEARDRIARLASDPGLRHEMGRRSRERAGDLFSSARMVEEYRKLYRDVIDSTRTTPLG
jgi:glycosyltransferase involved in cell wall biosynthesis